MRIHIYIRTQLQILGAGVLFTGPCTYNSRSFMKVNVRIRWKLGIIRLSSVKGPRTFPKIPERSWHERYNPFEFGFVIKNHMVRQDTINSEL